MDRYLDPENKTKEFVCLRSSVPQIFSDVLIDDIVKMFKQINVDEVVTRSIAQKFNVLRQKQVNEILPN